MIILQASILSIQIIIYSQRRAQSSSSGQRLAGQPRSDTNIKALREAVAKIPGARVSIRALDLGHLQAVNEFPGHIAHEVAQGTLPELSSIIGTADHRNLVRPPELASDGCGKTFRTPYLAHFALCYSCSEASRRPAAATRWARIRSRRLPPSIPSDAAEAVRDAARQATGEANPGERGYITLLKPEPGSDDSQDEAAQEAL